MSDTSYKKNSAYSLQEKYLAVLEKISVVYSIVILFIMLCATNLERDAN